MLTSRLLLWDALCTAHTAHTEKKFSQSCRFFFPANSHQYPVCGRHQFFLFFWLVPLYQPPLALFSHSFGHFGPLSAIFGCIFNCIFFWLFSCIFGSFLTDFCSFRPFFLRICRHSVLLFTVFHHFFSYLWPFLSILWLLAQMQWQLVQIGETLTNRAKVEPSVEGSVIWLVGSWFQSAAHTKFQVFGSATWIGQALITRTQNTARWPTHPSPKAMGLKSCPKLRNKYPR